MDDSAEFIPCPCCRGECQIELDGDYEDCPD